ncbi:hypothetical protein AB0K18_28825 [Nonomuraea sp. NPDC049421]|uniref:hypothetical protein n=1 Tax=Nonomuraea sp. NPDC049421 TaxID=3155275 RepID=UPI00342FA3D2
MTGPVKRLSRLLILGLIIVALLVVYADVLMLISLLIRWDLEHAFWFGLTGIFSLGVSFFFFLRSRTGDDR